MLWLKTSGRDSTTREIAASVLQEVEVRTSTWAPVFSSHGEDALVEVVRSAVGRGRREVTQVMTTYWSPEPQGRLGDPLRLIVLDLFCLAARERSRSRRGGCETFPRIMNVAVFCDQHSLRLGTSARFRRRFRAAGCR